MEKIYYANCEHKKAGMVVLTSGKTDCKKKCITRDKHFIMMKTSVHQEDVTMIYINIQL